jgi:pimeloyl-ACP methyl ester carboxylesterase
MTSRRQWLQSSSTVVAGTLLGASPSADARPRAAGKTRPLIVMVHGGFHWGGCFGKVANILAEQGYPVATPDNRSHGYDPNTYSSVKDMADYCAPVEQIVASARAPVLLLGHSLGGVTLTYLGEKYPQKIRRLIYLTAIMCPRGESLVGYLEKAKSLGLELPPIFDDKGAADGVTLKMSEPALIRSTFYSDCDDHDVKVAMANISPVNPLAPFVWVSGITPERFGSVPRAYIECTEDHTLPPALQRKFQADVPGAEVRHLASSHSPFLSQPHALANHILQLI